jgi:hypothetical protein
VLVKEMGLDLMCRYQRGQDDSRFLVAITLTEYLLDTSKSVPNQLRGIPGRYRERNGHAVGILRFICETIRHEKDRHNPSRHMVPAYLC